MPLIHGGKVVGVVNFLTHTRGNAQADELGFYEAVADLSAVAIANSHLLTELSRRERQINQLLNRVIEAQEAERERIVLDVHDGIAQTLSATLGIIESFASHPRLPDGLFLPLRLAPGKMHLASSYAITAVWVVVLRFLKGQSE